MSEGMPPQPPPEPAPQPGQPAGEPFQVKVQKLVEQYLLPPADPTQDTPDARMNRMLTLLVVIGVALFIMGGCLFTIASMF
ncbi:MAG: hypothetical protein K2R98_32605 [Gemmataceae bacterium]|nr:hypothetical protein [Gemmataceae bacterium]